MDRLIFLVSNLAGKHSSSRLLQSAMPSSSATQTPLSSPASVAKLSDLEIKDSQLIFDSAWCDIEADFGRENLRFPKEFSLLGGAPGSGKGTNTAFIATTRGLTCGPV